jgi:hypothetical protein
MEIVAPSIRGLIKCHVNNCIQMLSVGFMRYTPGQIEQNQELINTNANGPAVSGPNIRTI